MLPFLINQLRAEFRHLLSDDRFRLSRIVGVVKLKPAGHIGQAGIVGKSSGQRQESRHSEAPVDLLGNVVPVDQPVDRLANGGDVKRVKIAGLGEGGPNRVERQFGTGAVGYLILDDSGSLYSTIKFRVG